MNSLHFLLVTIKEEGDLPPSLLKHILFTSILILFEVIFQNMLPIFQNLLILAKRKIA
jgi:hypothetical protein